MKRTPMKRAVIVLIAATAAVTAFVAVDFGGSASAHSATSSVTCDGGVHVHPNANYEGGTDNNLLTITVAGVVHTYPFGAAGTDQTVPVPQGGATTAWSWSIDANIVSGNPTAFDESHSGTVGPCGTAPTTTMPNVTTTTSTTLPNVTTTTCPDCTPNTQGVTTTTQATTTTTLPPGVPNTFAVPPGSTTTVPAATTTTTIVATGTPPIPPITGPATTPTTQPPAPAPTTPPGGTLPHTL